MGEQCLQSQNKVNVELHNRRWWQMQEEKLVGVEAGSTAAPKCLQLCNSARKPEPEKEKQKEAAWGDGSNDKQEQLKEGGWWVGVTSGE